ncbi:MAG TPA: ABC transporter permease [Solirubrobacterales bacterium]|jgi:ABC-2 type transport system permease protein
MSDAAATLRGFHAVLRRDWVVYVSYRSRLVSQILTSLFSLTLFYYVSRLVHVSGFPSPGAYFGFVIVGIALISVLYSCFGVAETVRQELIAGTFERLLLSPFGPICSVLAMAIFPLLISFALAALTLFFGWAAFGLSLQWATVPLAFPAMMLALLAFLPFGLGFAALTVVMKQGNVGTSWVIALISIVGGLYFPVTLLPGWVQTASEFQPFTPATELLRHLLVGSQQSEAIAVILAKIVLFAAVLLPVSLWALSHSIRIGQRRGTIIEY